jgi:hypothetical protein
MDLVHRFADEPYETCGAAIAPSLATQGYGANKAQGNKPSDAVLQLPRSITPI